MGTEVHCESQLPGYYFPRDMNEDSNSSSWSTLYGDKTFLNGQYYNGFMPKTGIDGYTGYEKDALKQKMLEHEAIFKNQVYELHRLYRVQRNMMEEVKRKELHKHRISIETSSSSSLLPSQMRSDEPRNWHIPNFPLANPNCVRQSVLGSEVIDSPLSCTKGNNIQAGRVMSQNKGMSKDHGLSESRPSKVRKKLFDLQLPADEYIDTEEGEEIQDTKILKVSSYYPNGNHRFAHKNGEKLFLGGEKIDSHKDTTSDSCFKRSHGLADLNEPIQVEAATRPLSADFLGRTACNGDFRSLNYSAKAKPQFVDLSEEFSQNSQHGSCNGNLNNPSAENKSSRRGWLSYMYETGNCGRDSNCIPQSFQREQLPMSSHQTQFLLDKAHKRSDDIPTDSRKEELWPDRSCGYEISDRSCERSSYNHQDSFVASNISNPHIFVNSSDVANSWSHSVASWGKPHASLTQKLSSVYARSSFPSDENFRSSQPSAQSQETFGDKWNIKGSYRFKSDLESEIPIRNGFYHGSSSGSKEPSVHLSSIGYDNLNCNKKDVVASEHLINYGSRIFFKDLDEMDLKSGKDLNLNMLLPKNSSNEAVSPKSCEILDGKRNCEDHLAVLPWLTKTPSCKNAGLVTGKDQNTVERFVQASCNDLVKNETMKGPKFLFPQNVSSASSGHIVGFKELGDSPSDEKIRGFPIFGKLCVSKNDSSSLVSTSESVHFPLKKGEDKKPEGKHRGIDINVACDLMDVESEKQIAEEALVVDRKSTNFRNIDLNSCANEDEDLLGSSLASTSAKKKIVLDIDLEAPAVLETEEAITLGEENNNQGAPPQSSQPKDELDEVIRTAAEAIVTISLQHQDHHIEQTPLNTSDVSLSDSLLWFAEVIYSSSDYTEGKLGEGIRARDGGDSENFEVLDDFEAMMLQLKETREEDYMPKPFVPEIQELEETGATALPSRPRRGQARRGRQRRDFQRDILPGLVSLSRHEVTEDIQTFGSLMRATGHQWNGGLTRRNGSRSGAARGRKRYVVDPAPAMVVSTPVYTPLVQQLNNIEVQLEDRSLTGWGKTTRRPRRQRCPAGNNVAVALT